MQAAIIYANEDLIEAIEWFREWKREQRLISATLVCYPLKISKRSLSGKPVSVAYISRRFTAAARATGLDGDKHKASGNKSRTMTAVYDRRRENVPASR